MSGDSAMQTISREALAGLESHVAVAPMPDFNELYNEDETGFERLPPFRVPNMEVSALICHSSGTPVLYFQHSPN